MNDAELLRAAAIMQEHARRDLEERAYALWSCVRDQDKNTNMRGVTEPLIDGVQLSGQRWLLARRLIDVINTTIDLKGPDGAKMSKQIWREVKELVDS